MMNDALELAVAVLSTAPPSVSVALAQSVAQLHFGLDAVPQPLPGERDRNFTVTRADGTRVTLKFISAAEPLVETDMQIAVLAHLAAAKLAVPTPELLRTLGGKRFVTVADDAGVPVRVRAYSFLEGAPAAKAVGSAAMRHSVGKALAALDLGLGDFRHEGTERFFLWDVMQLPHLQPFAAQIDDTVLRNFCLRYLDVFAIHIRPRVAALRHQAVHNDLSKSNFVVDAKDPTQVSGILDFGDMVHAPLVADLAVTASYQMSDSDDPMQALSEVAAGFEELIPLEPAEREHLLDLIIARLMLRLLIPAWRATRFPENRDYILRSNSDAKKLLHLLIPVWTADIARRLESTPQ